jgi:hypothetical protein
MAQLISFNQDPSVLAKSKGLFEAQVAEDGTISFSLSHAHMSSPVVQAHIHFELGRPTAVWWCFCAVAPSLLVLHPEPSPAQLRLQTSACSR